MLGLHKLSNLVGKICVISGKDDDEEIGEVIISGDSSGLRSLGKLLIEISEIDQAHINGLPENESEHIHLVYGRHIGENKLGKYNLIISRLDTKKGEIKKYYEGNIPEVRQISEKRDFI